MISSRNEAYSSCNEEDCTLKSIDGQAHYHNSSNCQPCIKQENQCIKQGQIICVQRGITRFGIANSRQGKGWTSCTSIWIYLPRPMKNKARAAKTIFQFSRTLGCFHQGIREGSNPLSSSVLSAIKESLSFETFYTEKEIQRRINNRIGMEFCLRLHPTRNNAVKNLMIIWSSTYIMFHFDFVQTSNDRSHIARIMDLHWNIVGHNRRGTARCADVTISAVRIQGRSLSSSCGTIDTDRIRVLLLKSIINRKHSLTPFWIHSEMEKWILNVQMAAVQLTYKVLSICLY